MKRKLVMAVGYEDSLNSLVKSLGTTHEKEIKQWLSERYPHLDFDTYEGGLSSWFGMSSVLLWELGVKITVTVNYGETKVVLD